jgi:hypothetical protein
VAPHLAAHIGDASRPCPPGHAKRDDNPRSVAKHRRRRECQQRDSARHHGAVGPNHFVQWVNLSFAVYAKGDATTPPTLLYGPAPGNTVWHGFGGPCESTNNGDPIVLYDRAADRWVMTQLAVPNSFLGILFAPFYECIAVSATPDPLGCLLPAISSSSTS